MVIWVRLTALAGNEQSRRVTLGSNNFADTIEMGQRGFPYRLLVSMVAFLAQAQEDKKRGKNKKQLSSARNYDCRIDGLLARQ